MKIIEDRVVSLEFTLTDDDGEVIDSSEGEPLAYLHGHEQLVPGLERALTGREQGDAFAVTVAPEEGYGVHEPDLILHVDRQELPREMAPEVGMELTYEGPNDEPVSMWVIEVADDFVRLDGNHPLAGQILHFNLEVRAVRHATAEELEHGHAHADEGQSDAPGDGPAYTH